MNTAFLILFFGGVVCLTAGAIALPPTWAPRAALAISLGLMTGGLLLMVLGMIYYVRMRTFTAVLAETHRRALADDSGTIPSPSVVAPGRGSTDPERFVVDMTHFLEARRDQALAIRPKALAIILFAAGLGAFALFESAVTFEGGDSGSGAALGIGSALLITMAVLWALILYAPNLPNRPVRLDIDANGLWLTRSRGSGSNVFWTAPTLRMFLIDTRPSVRQPHPPDSPVLWLYSDALGEVPLSLPGAEALKSWAGKKGLRFEELPQGTYGSLPFRKRMNLPFGSIVSVISRS
jgi:hypothetical protein